MRSLSPARIAAESPTGAGAGAGAGGATIGTGAAAAGGGWTDLVGGRALGAADFSGWGAGTSGAATGVISAGTVLTGWPPNATIRWFTMVMRSLARVSSGLWAASTTNTAGSCSAPNG